MTRRGLLMFLALGVAWGVPYALIKIAVGELSPELLVLARTGLGALLLVPIALWRRQLVPVLRRWRPLLAYSLAELMLPWFFLASAEERLPSSTTGLLLAAIPLVVIGLGVLLGRRSRLTGRNWLGVLLGMVGVGAIVGLDVGGSDLLGVAELAVVVVGYALGPLILSRWMSDLPGLGVVAASLLIVTVVYLPVVAVMGGWPRGSVSAPTLVAVVLLAVVCTVVAFLLFFALVGEIGPVRTSAVTFVNPAVAVLLGVLWLGERFTVWTALGFVLVLAGSALVTWRPRSLAEPTPTPTGAD